MNIRHWDELELDDDVRTMLSQISSVMTQPFHSLGVERSREVSASMRPSEGEAVSSVHDTTVIGRHGHVPVRIYHPTPNRIVPAIVYFHGGGWMLGSLDGVDACCRALANKSQCAVVSVDYRLAPENRFPIPLEDCYDVVKWLQRNAGSVEIDGSRLAVAGDSAGGTLAIGVCLLARDGDGPAIRAHAVAYPIFDHPSHYASFDVYRNGPVVTARDIEWFLANYIAGTENDDSCIAIASVTDNFARMPPGFVITADHDPLRDSAAEYGRRLSSHAVPSTIVNVERNVHGFFTEVGTLHSADEAVGAMATFLHGHLHSRDPDTQRRDLEIDPSAKQPTSSTETKGNIMTINDTEIQLQSVSRTATVDEIMTIVRRDGGVIIKGFLTAEQIDRFNSDVSPHLAALNPGSTSENQIVAEFHGSNTKRLTNLVTHSQVYRDVLDDDLVHDLLDEVFLEESGTYHMNSGQLIEIGPGNKAQMLHRDLGNWRPYYALGPQGPEAVVNFLIALNDFTEENGATRVIPGSNRDEDLYDEGSPEKTIPALMDAGDVLFFSGKTLHGGGANRTVDEYRRAVAFSICPGILMGEEAFPFMVDLELVRTLPPRVQRLLDFRSHYPIDNPGLWMINYRELADHIGL
ncbi:alpha/beta hydrolase fold domain-containing protein [Rhodococcus wratislaviensis]|uniref:alpha/beta hydrolase fold domain-containing protein n=1 Tax=Rhodococcus wratislaviensis TaxID=44752 RepID=UPI0036575F79